MTFAAVQPKTLYTVQALRAVAASAVVAYHVLYMLVHSAGYSFTVSQIGSSGVDLFFVISGFIMIYTNHDAFGQPGAPLRFLRRRAIRIAPAYWFYTTVVVVLLALAPRLFAKTTFEAQHVVSSYFFVLSTSSSGLVGTVLQTGWTLCYEVYFYLIFAILLNLPRRYFLPLTTAAFLVGILGGAWAKLPVWASVVANPILLEFLFGALVAFAFLRGFHLRPVLAVLAMAGAVAAIALGGDVESNHWARVICWGLPSAALLMGAISLEHTRAPRMPRLLTALGDSSYSLYLAHPLLVPAFGKVWLVLHLTERLPAAALFLLAFTAALIAGHIGYLVVERPITRRLANSARSSSLETGRRHRGDAGIRVGDGA